MKYKVGDRVKDKEFGEGIVKGIEDNVYAVEFDKNIHQHSCFKKCKGGHGYWCTEGELELIRPKFTKSDLKDGDIVTYREGTKGMKQGERVIRKHNYTYLGGYNEDLTILNGQTEYDIIKVERPTQYETVFERKQEILNKAEKEYLSGVIRPWRDKVRGIVKEKTSEGEYYIAILMKNDADMNFPKLDDKDDYKGMEAGKIYSLEELEL